MKPITILHVTEPFASGIFSMVVHLATGVGSPFRHVVLHGTRGIPADYRERFPPDVRLIEWDVGRSISPRRDRAAFQQLKAVVTEIQPSVIHAHSSKAGALARLLRPDCAVLYSPQAYGFQRLDLSVLHRSIYWGIEFLLAKLGHVTVAGGEQEYRIARSLGGRVVKINNLIDVRKIGSTRSVPANGPVEVAMMGRIAPQKNLGLLADIARACEPYGLQFVFIGGGDLPPGIRMPANLTILGDFEWTAAIRRLARAQIYIQTSSWEGLSIAVLEAMTLGMPVVVSAPSAELVREKELHNGYVCREVPDYVRALKELAQSPQLIQICGAHSRQIVEGEYASEVIIPQWRALYARSAGNSADRLEAGH